MRYGLTKNTNWNSSIRDMPYHFEHKPRQEPTGDNVNRFAPIDRELAAFYHPKNQHGKS